MPSFIKVFVPVRAKACKDADFTFDISIQTFDAGLTNNPNERGYFRTRKKSFAFVSIVHRFACQPASQKKNKRAACGCNCEKNNGRLERRKKKIISLGFSDKPFWPSVFVA